MEKGGQSKSPHDFFRVADVSGKSSKGSALDATRMFHWSVVVLQEYTCIHRCYAMPYVVEWLDNNRNMHQWEFRP